MKQFALLALAVGMAACSHKPAETKDDLLAEHVPSKNAKIDLPFGDRYGKFAGTIPDGAVSGLSGKSVSITLARINADNVFGNCTVDGASQQLYGELSESEPKTITFHYWCKSEKKSLRFRIPLSDEMKAYMGPNDKKDKTPEVAFDLTRKPFVYYANASTLSERFVNYSKPKKEKYEGKEYDSQYLPVSTKASEGLNASTKKLSEKELKNLKKADLVLLRNAVYARHGYIFQNEDLAGYFSGFEWYTPVSTNVQPDLTPIEQSNVKLLKRFENYAKEYYQYFGR